jgi:hypothetical protein
MKTVWLLIIILKFLNTCTCNAKNKVDKTIVGTYVMQAESIFGKSMDTLLITSYNEASGIFQIVRRTGYCRIRKGKQLPKEYKQEITMAVWNNANNQLQEFSKGESYLIPTMGKELFVGTIRYEKIQD